MTNRNSPIFIGLMSGTSMDGVDGVVASFDHIANGPCSPYILAADYLPFPPELRAELMALQSAGGNEIHREALAANQLARLYAACVEKLLEKAQCPSDAIRAVGCHGQTIRHCPQLGYTRQINSPALLAELCGIDVIADFRSRDIAAGGQGAPLVPAFHHAVFFKDKAVRVIANIGGMSNISILDGTHNNNATGFDTGPGNVLLDAWISRHRGLPYDADGGWAASGTLLPELLAQLRSEPFFALPPPKSTGRDLFDGNWLAMHAANFGQARPEDVQATLSALTAHTLADAIAAHASSVETVYVCGGGAYNVELLQQLRKALAEHRIHAIVTSTKELGILPNHVEALAFAWLAQRFDARQAGNLPAVTGASGLRVLGALYPAGSLERIP